MRAQELIDLVTRLEATEGEFTDAQLLTHINSALRDITTHSRSIRGELLIQAVEGQRQYGLTPQEILSIAGVAYKQPSGRYRPLQRATLRQTEVVGEYVTGTRPQVYDLWRSGYIERYASVEIDDTASSTAFSFEASLPFVKLGDTIINLSDGVGDSNAESRVIGIDRPAGSPPPGLVVSYSPFINGTRENAEVGDEIRFISPSAAHRSLAISPAPLETDDAGEFSISAFITRGHREITEDNLSNFNDELELAVEFEEALVFKVRYYMSAETREETDAHTQLMYDRASQKYYENLPRVNNRMEEVFSAWLRKAGGTVNRVTRTEGRTADTAGYGDVWVG